MGLTIPFELCRGYLEVQSSKPLRSHPATEPAITISREAGAGAISVACEAVSRLNQEDPKNKVPWTIFDRNLVEKVLEDHDLPKALERFLPEDVPFELTAAVEEMLGLHPASWTLVQHVTDTMLRLAAAGRVILVGRGGNIITAHMPNTLHVRLVAPMEFRVRHVAEFYHLTRREAAIRVRTSDRARERYVKRHFNALVNDPVAYHLVINTGKTGFEEAGAIIAESIRSLRLPRKA